MSPISIAAGLRDKTIRLQTPGAPIPDGDGGFTEGLSDLTPAYVQAHITPATARDLERAASGTVLASATHLITIPFHRGVTTETVVTYDDLVLGRLRTFNVTGLRNPDEANIILVLIAEELLTT
jgi:head-tail adaptor